MSDLDIEASTHLRMLLEQRNSRISELEVEVDRLKQGIQQGEKERNILLAKVDAIKGLAEAIIAENHVGQYFSQEIYRRLDKIDS